MEFILMRRTIRLDVLSRLCRFYRTGKELDSLEINGKRERGGAVSLCKRGR